MTTDNSTPSDSERNLAARLVASSKAGEKLSHAFKGSIFGMPMSSVRSMPAMPRIPTAKEQNSFQSADVLVKCMAQTVTEWRKQVTEDTQPVVLAILQSGVQINVSLLAADSFHALRIEGTIDGSPCMLLTHQASVQLLCFVAKVEQESQRRRIGFIIDGQETSA